MIEALALVAILAFVAGLVVGVGLTQHYMTEDAE